MSLTVDVSPSGAGLISVNGGTSTSYYYQAYSVSTPVTITAIPSSGYVFVEWTGYATSSLNPFPVTVNCAKYFTAKFAVDPEATGSVSGTAWLDETTNSIKDNDEEGISGLTVNLYQNTTIIDSTQTGADGTYLFDDIEPGTYKVRFIAPEDQVFSPEENDSQANYAGWTGDIIVSGGGLSTASAGLYTPDNQLSIDLDQGWDLISMPCSFEGGGCDPADLLASINGNLQSAYYYNASTPDWKVYIPPDIGTLTQMNAGCGYWLLMNSQATLDISGNSSPDECPLPCYELNTGWNLVGFSSVIPLPASQYLNSVIDKWVRLYDFTDGHYTPIGEDDYMLPGHGYWLAVTGPGIIYPYVQVSDNITPDAAYSMILDNQTSPDFVILDVRTPTEYASGHIDGAINIDYFSATFTDDVNTLDKRKTYLVYCASGGRSRNAANIMKASGFREAYNMLGGFTAWEDAGLPVVQ